jgi:glutaminyl-peptide cyclotransferase
MLTRRQGGSTQRKHITAAYFLVIMMALSLSMGAQAQTIQEPYIQNVPCEKVSDLEFNGTAANASVTEQVELGPRTTGSNGSAALRTIIHESLTGWSVVNQTGTSNNMTFTNVVATLAPQNMTNLTPRVVIVAHYDSRDVAERDPDANRTSEPIPGANDAASGVAVLLELGRIIPPMDLTYEVELLFTDAEDQNNSSLYGAKHWVNEQTSDEINRTTAYIVADMVGDADLHLTHVYPGDVPLWSTINPLASALGLVETEQDCSGNLGRDVVNLSISTGVIDDHVPALNKGIPAIDLIDIRYGPGAEAFGGYWHTHEDTPDKVSAQSLEDVGRLIELGLRTNAWTYNVELNTELSETDLNDSTQEGGDETIINDNTEETVSRIHPVLAIAGLASIVLALALTMVLGYSVGRAPKS